jgi:hypothetical protein
MPARLTQVTMLDVAVALAVMMWTFASRREPVMPVGSSIPSCPSTTNSWGSTWMISRSLGSAIAFAASMARNTSSREISRVFPVIATTARLLNPLMWLPASPTWAESISTPAIISASSTTRLMVSTV